MQELIAAVRARKLVRVSRGVYRHSRALDPDPITAPDDAYLAVIRAAQLRSEVPLIFAGMSAARIWGLPVIGSWPERASIAAEPAAGGRSNAHLTRSYVGYPQPAVLRDGLSVTSLSRTAADVARTESMERAVTVVDAALKGAKTPRFRAPITKHSIATELESLGGAFGVTRAAGILSFADGLSGSPGESCSRVGMWRLGIPIPVLQQSFADDRGTIGFVDFWWPQHNLVGEFDGLGKYLRDEYTHGRSTAQIVMNEKAREDRLRALGLSVVRWDWPIALNLRLLEAKLRGAGLGPR